ncbi:MAG: nicotinamide riboside transporter PnuC [Gemmatimonadaceae bacterium]|jgi:nicotinamide mononucleotide transporter
MELLAAALGIACVWCNARERIEGWPLAIASAALYLAVFWEARLYAYMGLQGVFIALSAYGWYQWLHGGADHGPLVITRTRGREWLTLLTIGVMGSIGLSMLLARTTDAAMPVVDSVASLASVLAQWMMTRKRLEHWLVWIAINVVSIGLFVSQALYPTAAQYAVLLGLAIAGHRQWTRTWHQRAASS